MGIVTLVTLIAFEAMAVSTAMPVVARDLGGVREYGLSFSLFLTTLLLGVVLSGTWSDARGASGPMQAALALFSLGMLVCGLAQSYSVLLVGRALAGAGGGLAVVAMYVVIAAAYPAAARPKVFGLVSAGWVLPSIVGPALAGWVAVTFTWRAIFLAVPVVALLPATALLPLLHRLERPSPTTSAADSPDRSTTDLVGSDLAGSGPAGSGPAGSGLAGSGLAGSDLAGSGLAGSSPASTGATPSSEEGRARALRGVALAVGVGSLQWGLQSIGGARGFAVAALGGLLAVWALPGLLPTGTVRLRRGLPTVVALRGMYAAAFFGTEAFVPLMLVSERGVSPAVAGLALTGGAVGWSTGSWVQSRARYTGRRHLLLMTGGVVVGLTLWVMTLTPLPQIPPAVVLPIWTFGGLGMGLAMSSTSVLVLGLSAPGEEGRNSAGLQISDSLGSTLGIGGAGAVFAALHDPAGDDGHVFSLMWAVLGAVGVLSGLVALRAAPPMPRSERPAAEPASSGRPAAEPASREQPDAGPAPPERSPAAPLPSERTPSRPDD